MCAEVREAIAHASIHDALKKWACNIPEMLDAAIRRK
jgi:hypothetical protein